MEEQESEVTVRPARPADRAAALALCVDTFSWRDYIPEVWDQWLADPNGQLLIAEVSGVPVGLQHVAFLTPGEGWLQGLRVDPAVRRRGVANALLEAGLAVAEQQGATAVRLFTASDNQATQRMLASAEFRQVAAFTHLVADAEAGVGPSPERAVAAEIGALWALVQDSQSYRLAEGLYCLGWRCAHLTEERLRRLVIEGEVSVLRQQGKPVAAAVTLPAVHSCEADLWVAGVYGDHQSVSHLSRLLRARSAGLGWKSVSLLSPDVPEVVAPLLTAGFHRDHEEAPAMLLYEKELHPS